MSTAASAASLRAALVDAARAMNRLGINRGKSGNASVRGGAGFLITPSALAYDRMTADDIVEMMLDGTPTTTHRARAATTSAARRTRRSARRRCPITWSPPWRAARPA